MKNKKLLAIFPALGLLLSGCSFEDLMFWKKKDSQGDNTPAQSGVSLDDIVSKLKPIAASTLGKSESELVAVDYTSESEEGDYYTYNKDGLFFAGFYTYAEDDDMGLDGSAIYESLVGKLPSGSAIDNEKSEISEDDGFYCAVYASGDYYYVVYVYDYFALGMLVEYSIDIVPKTQYDAYYELVFSSGEDEDEDEEDEEDQSYMSPDFPASQIAEDLASAGVTDTIPAYSASGSSFYYYTGTDGRQIHISIPDGSSAEAVIASYVSDLKAAGYTEAGADDYGDMHYASPNGQIDICPWDGAAINYSKTVFVDIELAK